MSKYIKYLFQLFSRLHQAYCIHWISVCVPACDVFKKVDYNNGFIYTMEPCAKQLKQKQLHGILQVILTALSNPAFFFFFILFSSILIFNYANAVHQFREEVKF